MSRTEAIRSSLESLKESGIVGDWYSYAPGDRRGRRWVVDLWTFSTIEVEAFLVGAKKAFFALTPDENGVAS